MSTDRCPACNDPVTPGANYCPACGAALTDSPPRDAGEWSEEDVESGRIPAALTHLLALFTWAIGPLLVWLVSENPYVVKNAKNALMWQLMLTVYGMVAASLVVILVGIPLLFALWFLNLGFVVLGTVKASEGTAWQYPFTPAI